MTHGWTIGDHRVSLRLEALQVVVCVDDVPAIAMLSQYGGEWTVPVDGRTATFRRVRDGGDITSELRIDGVEIPPSPTSLRRGLPSRDATCPLHEHGERYREAADSRPVTCGDCHATRCRRCLSLDGVRCEECFVAATRELQRARTSAKRRHAFLVGLAAAAVAGLGVIVESPPVIGAAGLVVVLAYGAAWDNRRRARIAAAHAANRTPEERALLQDGAEGRAKQWRAIAPAKPAKKAPTREAIMPPAFGPYLREALRCGDRVLLPSGTRVPATASIALAATARDQREVDLDLEVATFRATLLRPLHAGEQVEFAVAIAEDGALAARARDCESGVELAVTCLDGEDHRLDVTIAGASRSA